MIDNGMVSISAVKVTPDLLECRIYLSLFQVRDPKVTMKNIEDRAWEIKRDLAAQVKHQLRRIPELRFYHDDTLDHVFKMEALLNEIKSSDAPPRDEDAK
jgi:ribosome-binding factor A